MTTNRLTADQLFQRAAATARTNQWIRTRCPLCGDPVLVPGLCDKCAPLVAAGKARETAHR